MREIKFRAWFHGAGDPRVEPYMKYSDPFPVIFWQAVDEFPIAVEVMQFTGLHDKNGKEIFEADIITDGDGDIWVVVYMDGAFWFRNPHDEGNRNSYDWLKDMGYWGSQVVAGNCFEHTQLLE